MKTTVLLFIFCIVSTFSLADERPSAIMLEHETSNSKNEEKSQDNIFDIKDSISKIDDMVNSQNVDGFLDCFTTSNRKKIKKQAAIMLAKDDTKMDISSIYILSEKKNKADVVVKYTVQADKIKYKMVSLLSMKKEDYYWKIDSETIKELEVEVPRVCSPSRYAMIAGRMRMLSRPEY
jgi:hypothetical protein